MINCLLYLRASLLFRCSITFCFVKIKKYWGSSGGPKYPTVRQVGFDGCIMLVVQIGNNRALMTAFFSGSLPGVEVKVHSEIRAVYDEAPPRD